MAASFKAVLASATAEIEAEATKFMISLKAKNTQTELAHNMEIDNIKKQQNEVALHREKEGLRHVQKLAETERAQNEILEKLEADIVYQNKAEVATRMIKSRQKRADWLQTRELEDLDDQRRRDAEEYEDYRQLKKLRAKRQMEKDDANLLFEQQQTLQRQQFDRDLHRTVVLDSLRKGQHDEKSARSMIKTIFNQQEEEKAPNQDEDGTKSEDGESPNPYEPYNPF